MKGVESDVEQSFTERVRLDGEAEDVFDDVGRDGVRE